VGSNSTGTDAERTASLRLTMAPSIKGLAAYKKKDGTLSISKDQRSIVWLPVGARDNDKSVSIAVANITSTLSLRESCR
jgi:transcription initiation factor TFIIH subunit 1